MLQLKYKGEFLDLAPGQNGELTRNSPLFSLDQVMAEYSTPITIAGTERNARLLGFLFFDLTQKAKLSIDVEVFSNGSYRYRSTLVIEGAGMNRSHSAGRNATGYLLTGISDFFSTIKSKKLSQLALGGIRTINRVNGDLKQANDSLNFTEDYVCQPTRNDYWEGKEEGGIGWMNIPGSNGNISQLAALAPFVKVEYLLTQIFTEHGWQIDTSGLNDSEWKRLILFTAHRVNTTTTSWVFNNGLNEYIPTITLNDPVQFALSECMPQDKTIAEFVLSLCNRYGWAPVCDGDARICYMIALKETGTGTIRNWTEYSQQTSSTDFSKDARVFQFKNTFEGEDQLPSSPSFEGHTIVPFADRSLLPDLSTNYSSFYDDKIAYVYKQNQYFNVVLNDDTNRREWALYGDNIYDAEVSDATDTIETKCTTLPTYLTKCRNANGIDYYGYFPACKQSQFQKWGIRTLLYHGRVLEQKEDGSAGSVTFPFASAVAIPPNTLPTLDWSNVYAHPFGGTDIGLIPYWWKAWTVLLENAEEVKRRYNVPFHEWIRFRWNDIIHDNGIQYLVKSSIEHVAYKGFVELTLHRLNYAAPGMANTSGIWLQMVWENVVHTDGQWGYLGIYQDADHGDLVIYAWSDAAGTVPYNPGNLTAQYESAVAINQPQPTSYGNPKSVNLYSQRTVVFSDVFKEGDTTYSGEHWIEFFRLVASPAYNIIP